MLPQDLPSDRIEVTQILESIQRGDPKAGNDLLKLVYDELRRLAAQKMAREAPAHTLQPTALVHEAWLHLGGDEQPAWKNRAHFFGAAAEAMRRILVDRATQSANRQLTETVRLLELQRAENFFQNGDAGTAVAHLAAMLRRDPSNHIAASRLISALVHRNWALRTSSTMQHTDRVETISFSPNGRQVLSASRDQTAKIWDAGTGKLDAVLQHTGQVFCAYYDSSGARIVTACADGTARIWDATTGEPRTPRLQHTGKVFWAEFSADDRWVVTASADRTARIWGATTGALKHELRKHTVTSFEPTSVRITKEWSPAVRTDRFGSGARIPVKCFSALKIASVP